LIRIRPAQRAIQRDEQMTRGCSSSRCAAPDPLPHSVSPTTSSATTRRSMRSPREEHWRPIPLALTHSHDGFRGASLLGRNRFPVRPI
jgi:hypothetical protein